eukprot:TRINITY_DN10536_c0_g1_i1.p1 TRINITY_DN10536_c0_g1~~TRINITY_DN10536_c0_g1_i1.p1  ORF type:complete len:61 (+),score=5.07 TRINITY_DN10536_c0_g1_i1:516-698(+)
MSGIQKFISMRCGTFSHLYEISYPHCAKFLKKLFVNLLYAVLLLFNFYYKRTRVRGERMF